MERPDSRTLCNKQVGPLLFERTYIKGTTTTDPNLSSDLISELYHLTRDTHAEMIQKFEMEDLKLIFQESETILFAATVNIKLPDKDAIDIITSIRDYWIYVKGRLMIRKLIGRNSYPLLLEDNKKKFF
ncbi:MAG: hypothetical protein ACFFBU_06010 [Promethearchaeota archaeon]